MSDVEIVVGIKGDDSGGRVIKRSLDDISASSKTATSGLKTITPEALRLEAAFKSGAVTAQMWKDKLAAASQQANSTSQSMGKLNDSVEKTSGLLNSAKGLFLAYIGTQTVRQILDVADAFTLMRGRIQQITGDTKETENVLKSLTNTANATGQSIKSVVESFSRIGQIRDVIGASDKQLIQFTDTFIKLGAAGGSSQDELKNSLTQMGQLLAVNKVRTQEWRSIMQSTPAVGVEIAKQLGISVGQMQNLIAQGKIASKDVWKALLDAQEDANKKFAEMPDNIGRAWQKLENELSTATDKVIKTSGIYADTAWAVNALASGIHNVSNEMIATANTASFLKGELDRAFSSVAIVDYYNDLVNLVNLAARLGHGSVQLPTIGSGSQPLPGDTTDFAARLKALTDQNAAVRAASANVSDVRPSGGTSAADEDLKAKKKLFDDIASSIRNSRTEQEKLTDELDHLEKLKGLATTKDQIDLINRGIRNTQAELAKVQLQVELDSPLAKNFKNIADEIQNDFKEAFKNAFDGGGSFFKKFADGVKATFKNLLLDLAYQSAVKPIVISVLGAGGQAAGLSSAAVATILGNATKATAANGYTASTAGSVSGGVSGLGGISSLYSAGKSFLTGGSITAGLAQYGAKASALLGGSFAQNMAVQKFITNAGTFSNLAAGAIGGISANLIGLGSKNAYVNAALSTVGGLIGSIGGPVGTFAGSFIGTALGGLFGGAKPSDKSQSGTIDFATLAQSTSGMTGKKYSAENASYRDQIIQTISSDILAIQSAGGSASGSANITIGNRDGLRYNGQNFGTNSSAFQDAIFSDLKNSITGLDATFQTIINKVGLQDSATLTSAFQFGTQYEATLNPKSVADDLADAIKVLDTNMQSLIDTATNLGLPIDQYTIALKKQEDAAIGALKAQAAGFSSLEEMTKTFKSFLDGEALSDSSSLSPTQKLSLAQSNFGDLLGKAQGGDLSVTQDLISAASTLIDLGRGIYASSVSFVNLEDFVRSSVSGIARAAGVPGYAIGTGSAASGMAMVGENGPELVRMRGGEQVMTAGQTAGIMALSGNASNDIVRSNAQIAGLLQDQNDETKASRMEFTRLRKSFDRLASNMKVNG